MKNAFSPERSALPLLRALAVDGAYGFEEAHGAGSRLAVASRRNGVSVRSGSFPVASAEWLVAAGLAAWEASQTRGAVRRLAIAGAGEARLAREDAPEGVDPFAAQHASLARGPADKSPDAAMVTHNQEESPIAWLATRKGRDGQPLVDAGALEAGERLRRDLTIARMLPRVTASWSAAVGSRGQGGDPAHVPDMTLAARQRVDQALAAAGPEFAGLLVDVCGFLKGLELIETERRWPRRSAKVVLVLALARLRRHYGIESEARGPERARGLRHWGAEDFRPVVAAPPD